MPYFDEIVKHLMDRFPYPFAVLALNTPDMEVGDSLGCRFCWIAALHPFDEAARRYASSNLG